MLVKPSIKVQNLKKKSFKILISVGARGWGRGNVVRYLMGTELQFRKMKRWMVVMVVEQ